MSYWGEAHMARDYRVGPWFDSLPLTRRTYIQRTAAALEKLQSKPPASLTSKEMAEKERLRGIVRDFESEAHMAELHERARLGMPSAINTLAGMGPPKPSKDEMEAAARQAEMAAARARKAALYGKALRQPWD
jgi:hypothetical protein